MCGIYGSTKLFSEEIVDEKLQIANFRGPDFSKSIFYKNKVVLAHNRLSIFDLDARSHQPFEYMFVSIVFNGEIYNYLDLKKQLEKKHYKFNTNSDTEVVCAMYIEYGEAFLDQLIGMFSFVIYDKNNNQLFGARDRMGQKPFYYYIKDSHFEFASNLKQISHKNNLELNDKTCLNYFYFGYFVDPETPYKDVYKLEPGSKFIYSLEDNSLVISKYWDLNSFKNESNLDYSSTKIELNNLLKSAVSTRLKADVPVGLFLSGGIDSSLITALAKESKENVNTYSIKFLEKQFDESDDSKKIAAHLKTNHHTFVCDLNKGKELIKTFYKFYDEPFADVSSIPSMLLSSEVSKDVTVALTGDGADEFFMGYSRYKWMDQIKSVYKAPYILRKPLSKIGQSIPNYKIKMLSKGVGYKKIEELYFGLISTFKTEYLNAPHSYDIENKLTPLFNEYGLLKACSVFDMNVYLNSDINTKVDRASMAYSLEARSPFMDHRVVEFAMKTPSEYKYKENTTKFILKDILEDYVPKTLFDRPKKGFGVPLESWLKKDLKNLVLDCYEYFKEMKLHYINYSVFNMYIEDFYNNKANHSVEIWKMVMFVLWLQENEN
jgi:asparagine synthase (glutamine-hydrolysing)